MPQPSKQVWAAPPRSHTPRRLSQSPFPTIAGRFDGPGDVIGLGIARDTVAPDAPVDGLEWLDKRLQCAEERTRFGNVPLRR